MLKRKSVIVVSIILVVLFILTSAAIAKSDKTGPVRLTIKNKSDQMVTLVMIGDKNAYALNVAGGDETDFTVERGEYDHTTYSCGTSATGTIDMYRQLKLVFTACPGPAPNQGEPGIEKVHIDDSPTNNGFQFNYN